MSKFENISIDDLGIEFMDIDQLMNNMQSQIEEKTPELIKDESQPSNLTFGPSQTQLNSFDQWKDCDGQFFMPYNKMAKIGKICDFVSEVNLVQRPMRQPKITQNKGPDPKENTFKKQAMPSTIKEKDPDSDSEMNAFTTVGDKNTRKVDQKQGQQHYNKRDQNFQKNTGHDQQSKQQNTQGKQHMSKQTKNQKFQHRKNWQNYRQLKCNLKYNAVDVKPEWEELCEFTKQTFDRLPRMQPEFLQNIKECGEVHAYDETWDKTTAAKSKPLKKFNGSTFDETVFDDPIMEELMEQDAADIFTTDIVAAVLMCSTKSNYSWDIEITKVDGKIIIDKRSDDSDSNAMNADDKINILNYATVCETAYDHQPYDNDTINGIKSLMREAQEINHKWLQACQKQNNDVHKFENDDPFLDDPHQVATRIGYVYKVWRLQKEDKKAGKKELKICIRCSVHTKVAGPGEPRFMNVYALNEHNLSRSNWRQDMGQKVIVLNKELEDNQFKVSRWIVQSLLADVEFMKLAFVTRDNMNDNKKHIVLSTEKLTTKQWANQINMTLDTMWSIIRYIVEMIETYHAEKEEEEAPLTEYVLLKEQLKMTVKLYKKDQQDDDEEAEEEQEEDK